MKAKFRKGKALGEPDYFEKASAILEELLKANDEGPGEWRFSLTDVILGLNLRSRCSCDQV